MGRFVKRFRAGLHTALDLFSYQCCIVCQAAGGVRARAVCGRCARALLRERLVAPIRPAAFASWSEDDSEGCAGVWAAATYQNLIRDLIIQFKFHGRLVLLPVLVSMLGQRFRSVCQEFRPDLLVPVPSPLVRFLYRGTNLPRALARLLSTHFRIPWTSCLRRKPFGRRQATKSKAARLRLPSDTFRVPCPKRIAGRRVLIVDDVLTTGATALACTRTLLQCGARRVGVLALSHG